MAICEFINELWIEPKLYPYSIYEKQKIREVCEIINSSIQPI